MGTGMSESSRVVGRIARTMIARPQQIGPVAFLVLHVCVASLLLGVAIHLHTLTLAAIREFHPEYPRRMVLQHYMPIGAVWPLHLAGPLLLGGVTLGAVAVSAVAVVRQSLPGRLHLVVLGLHVTCVLAAIYIYACAATQLAGFAAVLARGADY